MITIHKKIRGRLLLIIIFVFALISGMIIILALTKNNNLELLSDTGFIDNIKIQILVWLRYKMLLK